MVRSKVKLEYIQDPSARRATYNKRSKGLLKKASELSTLCDVDTCAIVYGPFNPQPLVWPSSPQRLEQVLNRYRELPPYLQATKMVNQDSFCRERIKKESERLLRLQKENQKREQAEQTFAYFREEGSSNLGASDLYNIATWIENKLSEVDGRIKMLTSRDEAQIEESSGTKRGGDCPKKIESIHDTGVLSFHQGFGIARTEVPQGMDVMNVSNLTHGFNSESGERGGSHPQYMEMTGDRRDGKLPLEMEIPTSDEWEGYLPQSGQLIGSSKGYFQHDHLMRQRQEDYQGKH